ncbi:ATP-binding protein [Cellulosilyticum sp. I15G10I2]|uniref:ATP-binding protein n=1 Tax=Cellulosilyticum sp. I15G10I2 TaxID=1892843 RepID=UPI00085CC04E|nr:ATP-binding protein [Cellulosilyticum sp. I15G10I2]
MRTSIQLKIIMIYLSVIVIVMMVIGTFIVYKIEERDYQSIQTDLEKIAAEMEVRLNWQTGISNSEDIKNKMPILNENHIYILDPQGRVTLGTNADLQVGDTVKSEVVIRAINTRRPATAGIMHFANKRTGPKYTDHARPVNDPITNEITAVIYVSASIERVYENMEEVMKTISLGAIVAMSITGMFGFAFSKMITSPIKQLTTSAKKLAAGDLIKRIPIESNDEIGELTQSFNYMATQLGNTMEAIISEKNKLEKIFEHMADGVMAFDREGVLIHTNSICYEMLGALNMNHRFDYIFPKLGMKVSFDELIEGEGAVVAEEMLVINGKYLSMHFAPYVSAKDEPDGLVVVMQDVTKQQKLDQMRKEFVANVSHELRTPLTTVKSYTETLMDGAIDDKELAMNFLGVMDKEADRMTTLVHDLLELSRIDNNQIQLNFRKLDIKHLVEETIEAQTIHINKKGHKLIYETDGAADYFIDGDGVRIKQVLHNILSNAIKYSIDPGTIHIKIFKGSDIAICIKDTGIGIPMQDLDRIFERFYRVDKARSRKMGGTGLGLSIAKELVELHGGTIKISSKVGRGTTVTLHFMPSAI